MLLTTNGPTAPAAAMAIDAPLPKLNDPQWDWKVIPVEGPVAPTPSGIPLSPSMIARPQPAVVMLSPFGVPLPVTVPQPGLGDEGKGLLLAPASGQQQKLRTPSVELLAFGMVTHLAMPQPEIVAPSPFGTAPAAIIK